VKIKKRDYISNLLGVGDSLKVRAETRKNPLTPISYENSEFSLGGKRKF
jgi:hypothetical protein